LPLDKNSEHVENVESYQHAHSRCSESRPIPIANVKTLTRGLGLRFDLWPFDLRVSTCRGPAMDYTSIEYRLWCW